MRVCHRVAMRACSSARLASASFGVSGRSRSASRRAMSCSASRMLLRCTSVGWAVSTGTISASSKKSSTVSRVDAGRLQFGQREADAAGLRRGAGQQVGAAAADVVLVLGDIGQVRKIGKRAHHRDGLLAREFFQQGAQFDVGIGVVFAAKAHGGLADGFDDVEDGFALLVAQHVAEQAAEQADVFLQRGVLVERRIGGSGGGSGVCSGSGIEHIGHQNEMWMQGLVAADLQEGRMIKFVISYMAR